MEKLDQYIKECNLVFTDTIDRLDFCRVGFDINKVHVNYDGSISLLDFLSSFNKLYLSFKNEYDKLKKLDIGKSIFVSSFDSFSFDNENHRLLVFYVLEPTITKHDYTYFVLNETNGNIESLVTSFGNPSGKNYYFDDVEFDKDLAKQYLDLFDKYSILLESYNHLKNNQLFGDGTNCIFTVIDDYKCNLLEGLNNFKICVGSSYFDTGYYTELVVKLSDSFEIDYANCKLVLDCKDIDGDKEDYDKLLSNIYLNKKYTKKRK